MKNQHGITRDALRFWLKKTGLRQGELAEKTGISAAHISNMAQGVRGIPTPSLEKICEAFGISLADFYTCREEDQPDIVFVPLVKAVPRAGSGGLDTEGGHKGLYAFHTAFLERKGGDGSTMRLFVIDGDSMEPTLKSGDMIMINTAERARHVTTGGVYLLRIGDELMVKRLENRPGGLLLIRSDNRHYTDIPVNKEEIDGDIEVYGRMVWSCREY